MPEKKPTYEDLHKPVVVPAAKANIGSAAGLTVETSDGLIACSAEKPSANPVAQPVPRSAIKVLLIVLALLMVVIAWCAALGEQQKADKAALEPTSGGLSSNTRQLATDGSLAAPKPNTDDDLGRPVTVKQCPIPVTSKESIYYSQGLNIETWKYESDKSCKDLASELLIELRDRSYELIRADYLDLYGNAWGCTVKSPEGESFVIAMLPEELGASAHAEDGTKVSIVHILIPDIDTVAGGDN